MLRINQIKLHPTADEVALKHAIMKYLGVDTSEINSIQIVRRSLDARKKPDLYYNYCVDVSLKNETTIFKKLQKQKKKDVILSNPNPFHFKVLGTEKLSYRPIIIGAGPAGLFCGYFLSKNGYAPIILERGKCVEQRQKDVEKFWETCILNPDSNVQFGEGGAGTFSDGKLNTLTKDKSGRNKAVLETFVKMGADPVILYDQKPHLGTDCLIDIVRNIRNAILQYGGEIRFCSKVTKINCIDQKLNSIQLEDGSILETDCAVLAIGHSARDTFAMLNDIGVYMEPKSFAVGFRMQHLQADINQTQYGDIPYSMPAAAYKVTAQTESGRGVYSFCMCPGGYVVNASSEAGRLAVNGMSYHDRAGLNSNSAMIVSVTPEDFPEQGPLSGVAFQRMIEENAYCIADGKVPLQRYSDFKANQPSIGCGKIQPQLKGQYAYGNLRTILPEALNESFIEGMEQIGQKIKDFNHDDVLMAGIESRTSSPIRITRDETLNSNILGLYPCGEGAGYAGGITSAAADGIYVAQKIAEKYKPF